ncbi:MAG TPA: bifunctional UDP-sugar hydrolase/5'-nucleotidase [Blastococcus sp.]
MRRSRLSLVVALALTTTAAVIAAPTVASAAPDDTSVQILAMNDFHGRISPQNGGDGQLLTTGVGPGPDGKAGTSDDGTELVGGAAYIAATVQQQQAAFSTDPNAASYFVGAGDLISASPFNSSVFKDEPTIEVLNAMGLDVSSVGNHEFDRGQQELRRISAATDTYEAAHGGTVRACDGITAGEDGCFGVGDHAFEGADFPYLAANVVRGTAIADAPILPPYQLLTAGDGKRVALIGVVTRDTPNIVSPEGIQGLTFLDEAATINHYADILTDPAFPDGAVNAIGVLVHEGGTVKSAPASYEGCAGQLAGSPIAGINSAVKPSVDFIVSAHTHTPYDCTLQDPSGAPRLVTQAGFYGKAVTDIRLHLNASGDVVRSTAEATNVPVRREGVTPDATVKSIVDYWEGRSAAAGSVPVGTQLGDLDRAYNTKAPVRDSESNLGNLIADAQLAAWPGADVAFMNPGGIRADIDCASTGASDPAGNVNFAETFTAQPFSNTVNAVRLSGKGIHDALEQQWRSDGKGGIAFLQLSVSGLTYSFDPGAAQGRRIDPASIKVGSAILDLDATYDVVANSFLIDGGDTFPAFTGERRGDKVDVTGPNDVDVLNDYFAAHSPVTPPSLDRAVSLSTDPKLQYNDDGTGRSPCNPSAATASMSKANPTRGEQVTVTGTLFEPREAITATLTNGRLLGEAAADDHGAVSVQFRVPADLPAGQQTVTLTGASGEKASTSFTLATVRSDVKAVFTKFVTQLLAWLRGGR